MEALKLMGYDDNKDRMYTVEEAAAMEGHVELIGGRLMITDKTSVAHNNAVLEIATALRAFIESGSGKCRVFTENVAVYCDELCNDELYRNNFFLPDVMVVCEQTGIRDDGVHCAPRFVAEVTSEATRKNDFVRKMSVYGEMGVEEYWIVDLQKNRVVRYLADDDFSPEIIAYPLTSTMPVHI